MQSQTTWVLTIIALLGSGCAQFEAGPTLSISPDAPQPGDTIVARLDSDEQGVLWGVGFGGATSAAATSNRDVAFGKFDSAQVLSIRAATIVDGDWQVIGHRLIGEAQTGGLRIAVDGEASPTGTLQIKLSSDVGNIESATTAIHYVGLQARKAGGAIVETPTSSNGTTITVSLGRFLADYADAARIGHGDLLIIESVAEIAGRQFWNETVLDLRTA